MVAPSPPGWVAAACSDLDALLVDHAYCELKAASTALSLVVRFGERAALTQALTDLAREEMKHFDRVHALVRGRGRTLTRIQGDLYVKRLRAFGNASLLDSLVQSAFIEARSCERFRLLAVAPVPQELRDFYSELARAEERHHELFLELAAAEVGEDRVRSRVAELAPREAEIVASLPLEPRIH
ncbi:MAG TPA: tRNA isopentenyl-2-thiomethyl-A-37 hydroxylase MiaE [Planctomycetota bacterium]|nr:tRNA isopentenyl-2-thiomethyl-A-37 hydroxylase MiaE [Planctomycetota bacterium]